MTITEPSTATMAAITQHGYGGIEVVVQGQQHRG